VSWREKFGAVFPWRTGYGLAGEDQIVEAGRMHEIKQLAHFGARPRREKPRRLAGHHGTQRPMRAKAGAQKHSGSTDYFNPLAQGKIVEQGTKKVAF
jgi:hypothetical protein